MAARLRHVYRHVSSVPAAAAPLGGLDAEDISSRYQRDGFVVVRNFLSGEELQRTREELFSYIENIIPDKSTEDCYFDGEWSKEGARGPVSALKYINRMDEVPPHRRCCLSKPTPRFSLCFDSCAWAVVGAVLRRVQQGRL